jgi:hypothetical protein
MAELLNIWVPPIAVTIWVFAMGRLFYKRLFKQAKNQVATE